MIQNLKLRNDILLEHIINLLGPILTRIFSLLILLLFVRENT